MIYVCFVVSTLYSEIEHIGKAFSSQFLFHSLAETQWCSSYSTMWQTSRILLLGMMPPWDIKAVSEGSMTLLVIQLSHHQSWLIGIRLCSFVYIPTLNMAISLSVLEI